jgi:hypothetical protein
MRFDEEVTAFLRATQEHGVRMLMVGGGAVNFHGYQRHSADIDFWIDPDEGNFAQLVTALRSIGLGVDCLPEAVVRSEQNISIKISPDLDIELITRFDPGCTFDEAWSRGETAELAGQPVTRYRVIGFQDLIESKRRAARPKDLLDIQELRRRKV